MGKRSKIRSRLSGWQLSLLPQIEPFYLGDPAVEPDAVLRQVELRPLERGWPGTVPAGESPIAGVSEAIARLEQESEGLKAQGIAREGCWIETGEVQGRQFRQAWWRSKQAMFPAKRAPGQGAGMVKSLYIGEDGSEEHRAAIAQRDRRNRVRQIERQLQKLKEGSSGTVNARKS